MNLVVHDTDKEVKLNTPIFPPPSEILSQPSYAEKKKTNHGWKKITACKSSFYNKQKMTWLKSPFQFKMVMVSCSKYFFSLGTSRHVFGKYDSL